MYTVEDKGSGVVENHLDIYFDTHKEALDYGLQKVEVFEAVEKTQ
ncbi:MAG: 3D domain-containing protein [Enterocloster sp.]